MRTYLLGVLTVIAIGTLLIAYGLLAPQLAAAPTAVPMTQAGYDMVAPTPRAVPVAFHSTYDPPRPTRTVVVHRAPRRDWKKTALVIGGSTAAGAGLGGIIGGGKGAAIGAAIGGGTSTLFEALHK
jgi:uncharacterized protein YcfJ